MTTHKTVWKLFPPADGSEDQANAAESDGEGDIGSEEWEPRRGHIGPHGC
jgi:hypothetical protein